MNKKVKSEKIETDSGMEFIGNKNLLLEDFELEVKKDEGKADEPDKFYIKGYANTKNKADSYGDIPKGDSVYDLSEFKNNPVLLVDHMNSVSNIAGRFVEIEENKKGLYVKALLMNDPHSETVKHALSAFKQGFGVAFSIGGKWEYNDKDNPNYLTKATIYEISLVAVGADPRALTSSPRPKARQGEEEAKTSEALETAVKAYREDPTLETLAEIKKQKELLK